MAGWVGSASWAKATLIAEVDGVVQHHPVDVDRHVVIAVVLGNMPTTTEEARCGFRLTLPYALHLEVLLSIEVEHEVVPWLFIIFTHRVKRADRQG